jgi:hypothetical protein
MMENFRGCRVLAYCVMCNHFHILHEVPPKLKTPLSDEQLLKRLGALYLKAFVVNLAKELAAARKEASEGRARDGEAHVQRIHERFTYRMLLLEAGEEKAPEVVNEEGEQVMEMVRKGMRREGTVCSSHGSCVHWKDAAVEGEILYGRSGDRQPCVCGRLVRAVPGTLRAEAQERRAQDARQGGRRGRCVVERAGSVQQGICK